MNYKLHYNKLIDKAKKREKIHGYTEVHHIIPKALGGDDSNENLVRLTAREHFVAHWLLAREYGGKMWHAFNAMITLNKETQPRYTPSSRAIAEAKENISKIRKQTIGKKVLQYSIDGKFIKEFPSAASVGIGTVIYPCLYGKNYTAKGYIYIWKSEKDSLPLRVQLAKKHRTTSNKRIVPNEVVRLKAAKNSKPVLQYTISGQFIKEWESQQQVKKELNLHIAPHLAGSAKTAGGYVWKYKSYAEEVTKQSKNSMGE